MRLVVSGVSLAIFLYMLLMLGRALFGWIMFLSPEWRPRGASLVIVEACYAATDPPIHLLRRVLPPIRVGHARVDLALPALFLACYLVLYLLQFAPGG
jgi:YggT family protein